MSDVSGLEIASLKKIKQFTSARSDISHLLVLVVVLAAFWLVCLPSRAGNLLSTGSLLVEGTGYQYQDYGKKREKKRRVLCTVFHDIMLSWEMWLVLPANEQQESSNAAGN